MLVDIVPHGLYPDTILSGSKSSKGSVRWYKDQELVCTKVKMIMQGLNPTWNWSYSVAGWIADVRFG